MTIALPKGDFLVTAGFAAITGAGVASGFTVLSNYLKMARRHCRRNHRSAHASCNTPR